MRAWRDGCGKEEWRERRRKTCHAVAALSVSQRMGPVPLPFTAAREASCASRKAHTSFLRRSAALQTSVGVENVRRASPRATTADDPTAAPSRHPFTFDHFFLPRSPRSTHRLLGSALQTFPFFRSSREESDPCLLVLFAVAFLCLHLSEMWNGCGPTCGM